MGPAFNVMGHLFAGTTLFIALGSAWFRRDGNQAFKGLVAFVCFWLSFFLAWTGPVALGIFAMIFISGTLCDWFWPGRCDECYSEPCCRCCYYCSCCCGRMGDSDEENQKLNE